ncbi:MAG: hypothetical protein ACP5K7_13965, partial [Verrucomicrobiia bacterium]
PAKKETKSSQTEPSKQVATQQTTAKSKEERLAELLKLYKEDKITAAQYHQERAKILSEK